jgi:very-short-patch-repair endonuclease
MLADGSLTRLHRGAYVRPHPTETPTDRMVARIAAVHHLTEVDHCFSHASAAILHGLPLWRLVRNVELYQATTAGGGAASHITRHVPMPPPHQRELVAGLPATSLARTAWDCMTSMPPGDALVVADAALHAGIAREALAAFARPGGRGHARAKAVLAVADDGAESPPESICRFRLLRAGYPVPATQIQVETRLSTVWCDLGWPEFRLVIEYDGRIKYEDRPTEAFIAEKRRHDALAECGWGLLRVTKEDLAVHGQLEARVAPHLPASVTRALRRRRELAW